MDLRGLRPGLFLLSLLAVAVWFSILMQFAATWHRCLLMVTALCLGMFSAVLTLYLVFIQEDIRASHDAREGVSAFIEKRPAAFRGE